MKLISYPKASIYSVHELQVFLVSLSWAALALSLSLRCAPSKVSTETKKAVLF